MFLIEDIPTELCTNTMESVSNLEKNFLEACNLNYNEYDDDIFKSFSLGKRIYKEKITIFVK